MNLEGSGGGSGPQDNGLSSSGSNSGSGPHGNHPVTSLVTTGPDGSLIDEASQQSTLSNASAGEESIEGWMEGSEREKEILIYLCPFFSVRR